MSHETAPSMPEAEEDYFALPPKTPEQIEETRARAQQREEESAEWIAQWVKNHPVPAPRPQGPRMTSTTNGYMGGLER